MYHDVISSFQNYIELWIQIRDDPFFTPGKNNLKLIEQFSINKVSLVEVSSCSNTRSIRDDPYRIRTDRAMQYQ